MKRKFFLKTMFAVIITMIASMNLRGDNVTYAFSVLGNNNITNPSGDINSSISFTTQKNSSSTDPAYNGSAGEIRLYHHSSNNGGSITLIPKNGAVISEVKITATSGYTPDVKYNVDGGADANASLSGTVYTISGISSAASLKIRNANISNTQLRIVSLEITYTASSCNDADLKFGITKVTKLEGDANFVETATSLNGSTGTITYESSDVAVATVDNNGEVTVAGIGTTIIKALITETTVGSFCADEASYTLKIYPGVNAKTYSLITSTDDLVADAKYLIVGIKSAEYYALGWQKSSNRHAIEIPVVNNEVKIEVATTITATQDEIYPYEITLKNSGSGFMLYDALHNAYLRPGTLGATGLYTNAQETYWNISFNNDNANIECTGSADAANFQGYVFMRFNAANTPSLFNCYSNNTGQTPIYLYKEVANYPVDTDAPVLTFNPTDGATDVPVNTTVTITSNEPLRKTDNSEITDSDLSTLVVFNETNASGTAVTFTATIDAAKKVITITPTGALLNSQLYYVALNPVVDTANNVTAIKSATFTTEAGTPPTTDKYVKITSLTDLTDGYYVVTGNGYTNAMTATGTNYLNITAVTPVNDTIVNPDASIVWEIKADNGKYTVSNGTNYVAYYGSGNNAYLVTTLNDSSRWNIAYTTEFVFTNAKTPARYLQYNSNSGQQRFACYLNSQKNISLYKLVTDNVITDTDAPVLTFNPTNGATNVPVNTTVTITSNEPLRKIDNSEITDSDLSTLVVFNETDASGTAVTFTATIDAAKKVITITP
ncbi:MAG: Ig-like domain-containing protein, partial [Prevotellaceae bacterium]|nr:Ig-like domain-containing protein [Prevotellaceae bacterium]